MSDKSAAKTDTGFERLVTPKEASQFLRVSLSWLAKARMRGDDRRTSSLGAPSATRRPASSSG